MNSNWRYTVVFLLTCGIFFIYNRSQKIIFLKPQSVHVWRQTDCVSYALNYYQNNQPFFEPQTHTLTGTNGHTASEFPIIYYVAAKLYHLFGPKEAIIRAINFLIFIIGATCLLWMGFDFFKHKLLAFIPTAIFLTSPYLYYYALNFLPDVPAISLALIGWFLIFRYFNNQKLIYLYGASIVYTLATLLKVSAGISFAALIGMIVVLSVYEKRLIIKASHVAHWIIVFVFVAGINFAWIQFSKFYNTLNLTGQNLLGLYPIWDADTEENYRTTCQFCNVWARVILHPFNWIWLLLITTIVIIKRQLLDKKAAIIIVLTTVGSIMYSLMWFRAYRDHDYYMINPFIAVIWVVFGACLIADRSTEKFRSKFVLFFIPVLFFALKQVQQVQIERYYHSEYKFVNENYFTIEPYLRSIGILRQDIVFSVPDLSPNITLYYLNQPGWTECFNDNVPFKAFVDRGVKYFISAGQSHIHNPKYEKFIGDSVGSQNGIYIYKIKR